MAFLTKLYTISGYMISPKF